MSPHERARSDLDETRQVNPSRRVIPISKSVGAQIAHHRALEDQFAAWHFENIDLPRYTASVERSGWRAFVAWLKGGRP